MAVCSPGAPALPALAGLLLLLPGLAPAVRVRGLASEDRPLRPVSSWHLSFSRSTDPSGGLLFDALLDDEGAEESRESSAAEQSGASRTDHSDGSDAAALGKANESADAEFEDLAARKVIYFNGQFGLPGAPESKLRECPANCHVTTDPEAVATADALIWNTGGYNNWTEPPLEKPPGQKWVFAAFFEPPNKQDEFEFMKRVETSMVDANGFIDWTMTFNPKSDFFWPVSRIVPRSWRPGEDLERPEYHEYQLNQSRRTSNSFSRDGKKKGARASLSQHERGEIERLKRELSVPRPKTLLAMVSNCVEQRLGFLQHLKAALPNGTMDIFGQCGDPSPCNESRDEGDQCHQDLFRRYKFFAAFENRRIEGYITEKFFRGLLEGMVPLAVGGRGPHDYEALGVPRDALVHVDDFANLQELADFLTNMDDLEYIRYFNWRKNKKVATTMEVRRNAYCELCKELHRPPHKQRPSRQSFHDDLVAWWFQQYRGKYCTLDYGDVHVDTPSPKPLPLDIGHILRSLKPHGLHPQHHQAPDHASHVKRTAGYTPTKAVSAASKDLERLAQ